MSYFVRFCPEMSKGILCYYRIRKNVKPHRIMTCGAFFMEEIRCHENQDEAVHGMAVRDLLKKVDSIVRNIKR